MNPKYKVMPCPCCGSTDVRIKRDVCEDEVFWYVECTECGVRTCPYPECTDTSAIVEKVDSAMGDAISCAVDTWNKRNGKETCPSASDESSPDYIETLAKEVKDLLKRMSEWFGDNE